MMKPNTRKYRFKYARLNAGFTQDEAARLIGVTKQEISHYETELRLPTLNKLIKMANVYHVSPDFLLGTDIYKNHEDFTLNVMFLDKTSIMILKRLKKKKQNLLGLELYLKSLLEVQNNVD